MHSIPDHAAAWIGLIAVPGVGRTTFRRLIERFGSPEAALAASGDDLRRLDGISEKVVAGITGSSWRGNAEAALHRAREAGAQVITFLSPSYPGNLRAAGDAPVFLYARGSILRQDDRAVAIVGTRTPTAYGMSMARRISSGLAEAGITIVSGLARGIDTQAHRSALSAGGRTIAVLGSGIDVPYPLENHELLEKIACSGAVLAENPPGTQPEPGYFPARNRIISGLALGTVIIEAAEDSGSLITAEYARQQQRVLFAVPGNTGSPGSKGTNNLIRKGAVLVESAADVLEALSLAARTERPSGRKGPLPPLSADEQHVLARITGEPRHIDLLMADTGSSPAFLAAVLTTLELKGLIRQLPGKQYIKEAD